MRIPFMSTFANLFARVRRAASSFWGWYRSLAKWLQIVLAIVVAFLLFTLLTHSGSGNSAANENVLPTVTLSSVAALSGNGSNVTVIGSVRSTTEAAILAQSSGVVTAVHASLGDYAPSGFVIAELENDSQRAAVLQAEGSYEAAVAARAGASVTDIAASARNTYTNAYATLDTLLTLDIDTFFGTSGGQGPQYLVSYTPFDAAYFPTKRQTLKNAMNTWRDHLPSAGTTDPATLLDEADSVVHMATALANDIARTTADNGSNASAAQLTALAAARTGLTSLQSSITAAKSSYQGQSTSATAGADASVKIALGTLRAAQAQLEKTLVRAPVSGTINFLPIEVGDYVAAMTHVATVAQNGTLEIISSVSSETAALLSLGTKVMVEDTHPATVTSIAPALDPVTKQVEVHFTLLGGATFLNGQSVRVSIPNAQTTTVATSTGPALLPLTALKLTPAAREVFSVGDDGRLVAHQVEIGDVQGDRIEVKTSLAPDLFIVSDARGLSEGQKVSVATSTP